MCAREPALEYTLPGGTLFECDRIRVRQLNSYAVADTKCVARAANHELLDYDLGAQPLLFSASSCALLCWCAHASTCR
jgi:hypothetical protein